MLLAPRRCPGFGDRRQVATFSRNVWEGDCHAEHEADFNPEMARPVDWGAASSSHAGVAHGVPSAEGKLTVKAGGFVSQE